jgi:hypothetical protein
VAYPGGIEFWINLIVNLNRLLDEEVQKGDELRQKVEKLANELEAERRQRIQLENRFGMGKGK